MKKRFVRQTVNMRMAVGLRGSCFVLYCGERSLVDSTSSSSSSSSFHIVKVAHIFREIVWLLCAPEQSDDDDVESDSEVPAAAEETEAALKATVANYDNAFRQSLKVRSNYSV